MSWFERDGARIWYETSGDPDGPPVLLIAPGGMRSTLERWKTLPFDPIEHLDRFRVIAMDQRNAGRSTGPVSASDGWHTYTADQLGLMDHLGVDRFAVVGMCIGGPYIMGLIQAAPERVERAVMLQPIGLENNRQAFFDLFDGWAADIAGDHPEADAEDFEAFKQAMFGGEFLFNATREQVAACTTPILLMMGDDLYHPQAVSREVAALAPDVTFVERWKDDAEATVARIRSFLA